MLLAIAEQVNGGPLSAQLDGALAYFANAAPRHTADEEESLFPRLCASADPAAHAALGAIDTLEQDHAAAREHHAAVDGLCRRWLTHGWLTAHDVHQMRTHLYALQTMYQQHIAIEDREILPTAGRSLSDQQLGEIGREMAARRRVTRISDSR
jgi:hemerythrin-like domain-containing protein